MAYRSSRLKRVEETKAIRSTGFYIALTVGFIALLLFFGVPLLSKFSSFLVNLAGKEAENPDNSPPPPPPAISTLSEFTKEEKLKLTGFTRPGLTVLIFFNDEKFEVLADAEGEFTYLFDLSPGINKVYAKVQDNSGRESTSTQTYNVTFDKEPPKLEIISPENGKQFLGLQQKQITIEGQTEPNVYININDRVVIVKSDGKFNFQTNLNDGENIFKIKATDRAGNETELEFKVSFVY